MTEEQKEELIEGFMQSVLTAIRKWFEGKAAIMIGELPVRFKPDAEN